ncbi:MAG: hypothetical protein JWM11_1241 [Planctomycetaceae bacterium]|nr:hypothetical protein [Planctomycetaceae bacterium]
MAALGRLSFGGGKNTTQIISFNGIKFDVSCAFIYSIVRKSDGRRRPSYTTFSRRLFASTSPDRGDRQPATVKENSVAKLPEIGTVRSVCPLSYEKNLIIE